jgi:RHS repeat-associated protein
MEAGGVVTTTSYYYAAGQRVAMRTTVGVSTTVTYLHSDHLGSTSLTTDAAGALLARVLYYPYGETRYTEGTLQTDYGYTGQRNEAGLGLMDYNARYYDPYLNRFISADTIVPDSEDPQSWNRYAYALNNPLLYVDVSGHLPRPCVIRGGEPRPKPTGQVWRASDKKEQAADVTPAPEPATPMVACTPVPIATPTSPPTPSSTPTPVAPSATPTPSALPAQQRYEPGPVVDLLTRKPDYHGVSVDISLSWLVMGAGYGISQLGLPEVGLPIALVGGFMGVNPVTGPIGVGGAYEWDEYGHSYLSGQASYGRTYPA